MKLRKMVNHYVRTLVFGFAMYAISPGYFAIVEAADWPNWRGPNHNGISNETGWLATWPEAGP